jgi:GNAT superfamily N-acetyltransferase
MQPSIVRLTRLRTEELQPLVAASEEEGFRFVGRLASQSPNVADRFAGADEALFGALVEGRLAGLCGLSRDPYCDLPGVGRLRHLYVLPDRRRLGIGSQLVDAVIAAAAGRFHTLRLRTENPVAARFYERRGFVASRGVESCTHLLHLPERSRGPRI